MVALTTLFLRRLPTLLAALGLMTLTACSSSDPCVPESGTLVTTDVTIGNGDELTSVDDSIYVYYTGALLNGNIFNIWTVDYGEPLGFRLNELIVGWQDGMIGMKEGGRRLLTIPPDLGYGCVEQRDRFGRVVIPENATTEFDITLVKVAHPK